MTTDKKILDGAQVTTLELYEKFRMNLGKEISDDNVRAIVAALLTLTQVTVAKKE